MQPEHPPIIAKTSMGSGIALTREERERHVYIVGKSGSGKSTTLFNLPCMTSPPARNTAFLREPIRAKSHATFDLNHLTIPSPIS